MTATVYVPYRLWIDDDAGKPDMEAWRSPPSDETDWKVARSSEEAIEIFLKHGTPAFIDFDHDLGLDINGEPDTAMHFLKWLSNFHPFAINQIEGFNVHSQNPQGRENIRSFMTSWKRSQGL